MKNTKTSANVTKSDKEDMVAPAAGAAAELKDLFIDSLKDIYWAENALVNALPKMAQNATSALLA